MANTDTRGAMRGRRHLGEVVQSRPANMVSKCGKRGQQIMVQSNYFRVLKKPEWCIHQYRVDFSPEVALSHIKRSFIQQHTDRIGSYVFDGETIFCSCFFVEDKNNRTLEVICKDKNGDPVQMKLKHVGLVDATNFQHLQVLNLILRHAVEKLQMQLVGRHYYDAGAKVSSPLLALYERGHAVIPSFFFSGCCRSLFRATIWNCGQGTSPPFASMSRMCCCAPISCTRLFERTPCTISLVIAYVRIERCVPRSPNKLWVSCSLAYIH